MSSRENLKQRIAFGALTFLGIAGLNQAHYGQVDMPENSQVLNLAPEAMATELESALVAVQEKIAEKVKRVEPDKPEHFRNNLFDKLTEFDFTDDTRTGWYYDGSPYSLRVLDATIKYDKSGKSFSVSVHRRKNGIWDKCVIVSGETSDEVAMKIEKLKSP